MTTIRPNDTVAGGSSYNLTGGASANACLSDDSDASYIRKAGASTASVILGMGTFSIASSQRVKQVRLRCRAKTDESDSKLNLQLGLLSFERAPDAHIPRLVSYWGPAYSLRGVNTLGEYAGPYYAAAPDGGAWDQDRIDGLRVQVTDYRSGTSRGYLYEVYVDVDLAAQPSTSVTSPSGSVSTTSLPTVTWEFTDTDGDAQAFYEVKVFTAAQYGDPTFDPSTSSPEWTSGEKAAADQSLTVGEYLVNGAYRAYVRVAKTVNGAAFWSAWAYSGFTIAVSPPTVPTLTLAFHSATCKVQATATGAAPTGLDSQVFEVQRSLDEVTWVGVRDASRLVPNGLHVAAVADYEAERVGTVYYRVRAIGASGDNEMTSAWSASASVTVTNDGTWWVKAVSAPSLNRGRVRVLAGLDETIDEDTGVFRPQGRTTALVVAGSLYGRDGSYRIATLGEVEWSAIYALIRHQGVLLVQDPGGQQKYVRVTSRNVTTTGAVGALRREATLGYVEVAA